MKLGRLTGNYSQASNAPMLLKGGEGGKHIRYHAEKAKHMRSGILADAKQRDVVELCKQTEAVSTSAMRSCGDLSVSQKQVSFGLHAMRVRWKHGVVRFAASERARVTKQQRPRRFTRPERGETRWKCEVTKKSFSHTPKPRPTKNASQNDYMQLQHDWELYSKRRDRRPCVVHREPKYCMYLQASTKLIQGGNDEWAVAMLDDDDDDDEYEY